MMMLSGSVFVFFYGCVMANDSQHSAKRRAMEKTLLLG